MTIEQLARELEHCPAFYVGDVLYVRYRGRWANIDALARLKLKASIENPNRLRVQRDGS